ncbi:CBP4-domain-containing protein [Venturia nashicola]|uniref:Cytochrome b mRNA-processing protein 4 n=1 Tax=Venturia nashicola TaxID=86259 RepID=A0A4Z1P0S6_9PEZI|nr:CBP4-domain-containing protein [Venturia nashicola]TLD30170.1 CBP4-domain-containing protein [Venturia nashicola]
MPGWRMYAKMLVGGGVLCIGGPALVYYVSPTEEELFKRYNPDLQRRSLENRLSKQQDFDKFVTNLKEYSKSDKPIWEAQADAEQKGRDQAAKDKLSIAAEIERRRKEVRDSATSS